MSTIPSPSIMSKFAHKPQPAKAAPLVVDLDPSDPGKIVRPGVRRQRVEGYHDGVVKAKHLKPGQTVQAFLHGAPRGSKRTVKSVERNWDGSMIRVTFSSDHPETVYKAAYRFYDESLAGVLVSTVNTVPALVAYEEV